MNKSKLKYILAILFTVIHLAKTYIVVRSASVKLATNTAAIPKPWHTKPITIVVKHGSIGMNEAGPIKQKAAIINKLPMSADTFGFINLSTIHPHIGAVKA